MCRQQFDDAFEMASHILEKHQLKCCRCFKCGKPFFDPEKLQYYLNHTVDWNYKCVECKLKFRLKEDMRQHFKTSHQACEVVICPRNQCEIGFKTDSTFAPYICEKCGLPFNQLGSLQKHFEIHQIEHCDLCDKILYHSGLKRIGRAMRYQPRLIPPKEGKPIKRTNRKRKWFEGQYIDYLGSKPGNRMEIENGKITLTICDDHTYDKKINDETKQATMSIKNYQNQEEYVETVEEEELEHYEHYDENADNIELEITTETVDHLSSNETEEDYSDEVNPLIIFNSSNFKEVKAERLICDECGVSFGNVESLTNHQKTHFKKKPFACNLCGKSFILKSILLSHKKIHHVS